MKVEVHDRLDAVGRARWTALHAAARTHSPFLSWLWQVEWIRAFGGERRLEVWTVEDDDGALIAALPLYEALPGLLRSIGGTDVSDYLDLLVVAGREEDAWNALLAARAAVTSVWELNSVPRRSVTVTGLPALAAAHRLVAVVSVVDRCPVLSLPVSWEAYLTALPSRHRHELLRKVRRLEREVPEAAATVCRGRADVERRLDDFLQLHRLSRPGKARFMDAQMEGFFRATASELAESGGAALWFLDVPAGPVAAFITLEWDESVGLYNSGFDPDTARWSPGLVLLTHLVRDAIERRRQRFDFLRGDERYKYEFGPSAEDVCSVVIGPPGLGAIQ